jgi:hypothetical protein
MGHGAALHQPSKLIENHSAGALPIQREHFSDGDAAHAP